MSYVASKPADVKLIIEGASASIVPGHQLRASARLGFLRYTFAEPQRLESQLLPAPLDEPLQP